MEDVLDASQDQVIGRCKWHGDFFREPRHGVANALRWRFPNTNGITTVGMQSGASVPSIQRMWLPRGTLLAGFMNEDTDFWRGKRRSIEIEVAVYLGPCR
jgi:hypothetical protein